MLLAQGRINTGFCVMACNREVAGSNPVAPIISL